MLHQTPDPLTAALELAERGVPVFPCNPDTKAPLLSSEQGGRGHKDATTDQETIRKWWAKWGGKLIWGVPTGRRTGIVVLDVDIDPGKGLDGRKTLETSGRYPPPTRAHLTPRGGLHLVYRLNPDDYAPTDAGVLGDGLDRRGDGGYVIWYPAHGGTVLNGEAPESPPEWLLLPGRSGSREGRRIVSAADAEAILREAVCDASNAAEGSRNATLSRSAFIVGQLVEAGMCDIEHAGTLLIESADSIGLDRGESVRVIDKAFKRALNHPGFESVDGALHRWFGEPVRWVPEGLLVDYCDAVKMRKPLRWLIKKVLQRGVVAMIFGEPEAGKSMVAIDWALHVACDREWNGAKVSGGPIIYVSGEGFAGLTNRFAAWGIEHGEPERGRVRWTQNAVAFLQIDAVGKLIAEIDSGDAPVLIVIDTVATAMLGGDDKNSVDAARFMDACKQLVKRYDCTVLVVHHSGHADKGRAKGAIEFKAGMDNEYGVVKAGAGSRLVNTKMKESGRNAPVSFELKRVPLGVFDPDTLEQESGAVVQWGEAGEGGDNGTTEQDGRALGRWKATHRHEQFWTCLGEDPVRWEDVRAAWYQIADGASKDAKRKALDRMVDTGSDRGWFTWKDNDPSEPLVPNPAAIARDRDAK